MVAISSLLTIDLMRAGYDFREGRCRGDVNHVPYVTYAARRPDLLAGAGALTILGIGLIVLGQRKK
jgi:hypothetical protein